MKKILRKCWKMVDQNQKESLIELFKELGLTKHELDTDRIFKTLWNRSS